VQGAKPVGVPADDGPGGAQVGWPDPAATRTGWLDPVWLVREGAESGSGGYSAGDSSDRVGLTGRNEISPLWWCCNMFMVGPAGLWIVCGWMRGLQTGGVVWTGGVSQTGAQRVACQSIISIRDVQMA
jgi:hypothetical protein